MHDGNVDGPWEITDTSEPQLGTRFLTVHDIANRLQIPASSVYKLVKTKVVPAVKIGKHIRVPEPQFNEWADSLAKTSFPTDQS